MERLDRSNKTNKMPIPAPIIAAGVQAGSSLIGQGINAAFTSGQNKKEREWNEKMYGIQRQDALADYHMQNLYNSPAEQMKRLREAGLNPNLVYGNGVDGNASGQVRGTNVQPWNPRPPQFDVGGAVSGGIAAYLDTQIKQAQIDNLKTANTVQTQEALLKAAQVLQTTASTDSAKFDLGLKTELRATSVDAAKAALANTEAQTKSTLDENDRRAALQATTLQQAIENILNSRMNRSVSEEQKKKIKAEIESIQKDVEIKKLDIELKRLGIQPGDSMFTRILARMFGSHYEPGSFTQDMPWSRNFDSATFKKRYLPKK